MSDHTAWLQLALARGINGRHCAALLSELGSATAITSASSATLAAAGISTEAASRMREPDPALLQRSLAWLEAGTHHLVSWADTDYPALLREIDDPPVALFVAGNPAILSAPQLAIVGSRNATGGGIDTAGRFAAFLARAGFCITSGLALGIDAAAHRGALDARALTIAVCGTGPDQVYPAAHQQLAGEIAEHGAVVSEYPPGTGPRPQHFPQRNRLISGMSLGTLVVEAGQRSGALITARLAAEQGREVFAIPGSIHNPMARGCHRLIRDGAKLVETAADIVDELGGMLAATAATIEQNLPQQRTDSFDDDPEYARLLQHMGWDPVSADTLAARSALTSAEVSSMLLILELDGRVDSLAGGRYQQREAGRTR